MSATSTRRSDYPTESAGGPTADDSAATGPSGGQTTVVLSWVVVVLLVTAAALGLAGVAASRDGLAVAAGLRGGDVVNLLLVAPALTAALLLAVRGSYRARLVWVGALGYIVYAYAYVVFVPTFNGLFLLHIALFTTALYSLVLATVDLPVDDIREAFYPATPVRWVGGYWILVAAAMIFAWGSASVQFAVAGDLPTDVLPYPEWRVHLGYVMDLALAAPSAGIAGVLLWRRAAWGYALATSVSVAMFGYQLNYAATAVFMARAAVPGVSATDPTPFVTAAVFAIPMLILMRNLRAGGIGEAP